LLVPEPYAPQSLWAAHEKDQNGGFTGHLMSDYEKGINQSLAESILNNFMGGKPGKVLDIGSKFPYLSYCFKELGCEAFGMDNIEIVPEYSKELDVPMLMADFEALTEEQIREWTHTEKFQAVTMIHLMEHLYNPLAALGKIKSLLADDGILFLRLPDHGVSGFERDLDEGHYTIHPFFHSLSSILELLVQGQDLFTIDWTSPMDGAGQRDIVLRPIQKKPEVWCGMIVKNEERDLPRVLKSIEDVVDGLVVIDTGSTDKTEEVAKAAWTKPLTFETYTGASKQDESGDWKLWDFSKARNIFVDKIDRIPSADYLIWFDADDELLTPENLKRAFYLTQYKVFGIMIETDGMKWVHHRAWKTREGVNFSGRIHEYPNHGGRPGITLKDSVIHHDAAPGVGENSNQRNLRILEAEIAEDPNPRTAFYLANTHKDAGRYLQAVKYYDMRINFGDAFRDEYLFSCLYKGRCERAAGMLAEAEKSLLFGLSKAPDWSEFWMELGYMAFQTGDWNKTIGYCLEAFGRKQEPTELWREPNKYTDQPTRMLSFCYENLGDKEAAYKWAAEAKKQIGCEDKEWDQRVNALNQALISQNYLKKTTKKVKQIALNRPGAVGDILITLNLIPSLKKKHPNCKIHYYCHPAIGAELELMFKDAGVDAWFDFNTLAGKAHEYEKVINLIGYPLHEDYPNTEMRQHLIKYFAKEMGLPEEMVALSLPTPSIDREKLELPADYATLQVKAGWSVYKSISAERWGEIVKQCPSIPFIQIGGSGDPKIPGVDHTHMGKTLKLAIDLIANAKMHVGVDSFPNHVTNYIWSKGDGKPYKVPAVILWGSTSAQGSGYDHNLNIGVKLPCRPCYKEDPAISSMSKGPCDNPPGQDYAHPCHACMAGIPNEVVAKAIKNVWEGGKWVEST
jgi:glycosyltransferase involved in cell wall biosynthesis/2-polyprenyl-3-methyl-5-hydroxy-6-metoxy-1,4-benzoquinol methylase